MLNDKNAILLKTEEFCDGHANSPTIKKTYKCSCGQGVIEYAYVPGFDDRYATINCKDCKEHFNVVLGCGHLWELQTKD